ncbi:hypothetical protein AKJ08_0849 [Vulgatibacter incomptus]|uniref:Uncharacterized protein n=1 Tax=Vulgatibacter incomptus TaxID=1391653 RepID=A0A0K1PAD3_9BACT|nr:hypothetical protein AKJ08_0849 [Vulgatibacter incomptus]
MHSNPSRSRWLASSAAREMENPDSRFKNEGPPGPRPARARGPVRPIFNSTGYFLR